MQTISGIKAAWMEKDGQGSFGLSGKNVTFVRHDGLTVSWSMPTAALAEAQLRLFRAATKYPETRDA